MNERIKQHLLTYILEIVKQEKNPAKVRALMEYYSMLKDCKGGVYELKHQLRLCYYHVLEHQEKALYEDLLGVVSEEFNSALKRLRSALVWQIENTEVLKERVTGAMYYLSLVGTVFETVEDLKMDIMNVYEFLCQKEPYKEYALDWEILLFDWIREGSGYE